MTKRKSDKTTIDTSHTGKLPPFLEAIWRDNRIGWAIAIGTAIVFGALVALIMPRGPTTATLALLGMSGGLAAGLIAGIATRSRWAMLLAPVAHMITMEITWLGVPGVTVDAIRLDNMYGILALIFGRGFYALMVLLPMVLGASLGAWFARRLSGRSTPAESKLKTIARWTPTVIVTLVLIGLAVLVVLPPGTPPILGADGKPLPGSIAELQTVKINGDDQAILIRGHSVDNPVLLYLSGGPGQSDMAFCRVLYTDLEKDFVVVSWDQRGNGKSYSALDPVSEFTFNQSVSDTIELTNYLRERFGEDRIYLMGESYGSLLGVQAVKQRPDLYYAYIGSGQMVSPKETDRRLWQDMQDYANRTGNEQLGATMRAYGQPPYQDIFGYMTVMSYYDALAGPYTPPAEYMQKGQGANIGPYGVFASEYSFVERVNVVRGLFDVFSIMYPQLQEIDYRQDTTKLDVPVYILDAGHELTSRRNLATEWYNMLEAPHKEMITFENAGHSVAFEEEYNLSRIMRESIVPATYTKK
ncbi:alpha/beta fold hydrolase [Methanocella arvoryzae]|uniref:Predicted peptidase (S10/S33 family) n=1 Tax=Methanocella arvoryzae (strain DSM 22066 / NBRC 105507 / MRE50) TaxID=351160 RepID=Q0W3X1_METAR|nr:alpha/beta fold hydrolase [Methanocella arvoryzae]CAJ36922.1 predicted peptidase (S10/S33 family) [Methanocella arvoryzae MRE50]